MMLQPPKVSPNQAQLLVIPENAIEVGKKLGGGAFGTVYKVKLHSLKFIAICQIHCRVVTFQVFPKSNHPLAMSIYLNANSQYCGCHLHCITVVYMALV